MLQRKDANTETIFFPPGKAFEKKNRDPFFPLQDLFFPQGRRKKKNPPPRERGREHKPLAACETDKIFRKLRRKKIVSEKNI